jgi:hypothetical protein
MKKLKIYPLEPQNDWDCCNIQEYNDKYNKYKRRCYKLFTIYEDDEYNNVLWPDININYFLNLLNKLWGFFFNKPNHNSSV